MGWGLKGWGDTEESRGAIFRQVIRAVLEVVPGGVIRTGKSSYADDAGAGFWLGVGADGTPRLNLGDAVSFLKWTGTRLEIAGGLRTRNAYVQIVDESSEDYGEGVTLLQGAWLESGALRWKDAEDAVGAFLVGNANGAAGTAVLLHAYPRETGSGNVAAISLTAHDKAYGETGGAAWSLSLTSGGEAATTAALHAGGGADQVQLRIAACEDGQSADLIRAVDAAGDPVLRLDASGALEIVALHVAGQQVVGAQQAAIADLSETGSAEDGVARAAINDILAALRAHGLIG